MAKTVEDIEIPVPWGHVSDSNGTKTPEGNNVNVLKENKHTCDECNSRYFSKSSLNRHMMTKHSVSILSNEVIKKHKEYIKDNKVKNFVCKLCNVKYELKFKFLQHMRIKHDNLSDSNLEYENSGLALSYKCNNCDRRFFLWKSLLRHYRINHPGLSPPLKKFDPLYDGKFICDLCRIEFLTEDSLEKHLLKYHIDNNDSDDNNNSDSQTASKSCECSICNHKLLKSKFLFDHYRKVHGIEIKSKTLKFTSYNDFLEWKENEEKRCVNKYTSQHGPRKYKKGLEIRYFYCHRSGYYKQKGEGKRRLKHQGSKKFGKMCPSRMTVKIIDPENIIVDYVISHVGHDSDICHLTLSQKDRVEIANKIAMRMTFDDILNELRNSDEKSISCAIKTDRITRKDLHNIVKSFKLTPIYENMKRMKNENVSSENSSKRKRNKIRKLTVKSTKNDVKTDISDTNRESNDLQMVIKPFKTDESPTEAQPYFELHDLVIIDSSNITTSFKAGDILTSLPITVAPELPVVSSASSTSLVIQEVVEQENSIEQPVHCSDEETIRRETFEESKQNFINEMVGFISENVNNTEELLIAQEVMKSFVDTIKHSKENFFIIPSIAQRDNSSS